MPRMPGLRFTVLGRDPSTMARVGRIRTPHGTIASPAFAPVGTQGTVKALTPRDLAGIGVELVMANAYHLAMRPGADRVARLGGLHALAGWDGPLMTDSGGFQVFSLATSRTVDDDGVTFRSPVDGSVHRFTPEEVVAVQGRLGADLVMVLDVCSGFPIARERAAADAERTHAWARRAADAHDAPDQALYGIVQGSVYPDLRAESARAVAAIGFEGYAVGGVSVGESKDEMCLAIDAAVSHLPADAPRHLLGVGHPEDIVEAVARGIDTFDCVMPTRVARNGGALTMAGRINLRNAAYADDPRPIDETCACYACTRFSRGAVRHFLLAGEILALTLVTLHNLAWTVGLMARIREAIAAGRYAAFRDIFLATYAAGAFAPAAGAR